MDERLYSNKHNQQHEIFTKLILKKNSEVIGYIVIA